MPQKTNLNISPYYDDFDKEDQFYRVLFKPGFPVQARELTTLQSSLQNQIESFGSHIFKDGSMVIPGNINYDNHYYSVKINNEHLGIPVSLYLEQLVGLTLRGQSSGITLKIDSYELAGSSTEINDLTIFVQYVKSGDNNEISFLDDGEILITEESFIYGNTAVNEGETVITLVDESASAIGSAVGIQSGTYFIRGSFVDVSTDKIVLDPYTNVSSYRVGLNINEELVTAKDDDSLYDNARGFSNYAAPGADRLKITTTLGKKSLTDFNDTNFIELLRIQDGELKILVTKTQYSLIRDYFASRTFDESGHYSVNPFRIQVENSLNDGIANDGLYKSNETTEEGNTPSDDLMCIKVSAGKAYVKGYDIDLGGTQVLDIEKPRDKREVSSALVPYQMGTILKVNNIFGVPVPNIRGNSTTALSLQLYSERTGSNTAGSGEFIGRARVYSFNVTDASYVNDSTQWDLHVFDMQIFTRLTLNKSVTNTELPQGSFVRGVSSGAYGYSDAAGGDALTINLSDITGKFIQGEQIVINEDPQISRSIGIVKNFGIQDVKSVYQDASSASGYTADFVGDVVLDKKIAPSFSVSDQLNINAAGIATCAGRSFSGIKTDTIVRYQLPGETIERFNRIISVANDGLSITLASVPTISGVCNGALPTGASVSPTFKLGFPNIKLEENKGLFSPIGNSDISDVNLSNSNLVVGVNITGESTDGSGVMTFDLSASGISSAFYESFDEERYSVHYSDGSIEDLTSDQFVLGNNGQSVTINGLTASQSNVVVSTTLKKQAIKSKQKNYIRSQKLAIETTAVGINTALTGMPKGTSYGLRVEDREISLNYPDVVKVVGVFESIDSDAPVLDKLTFPSGLGLDTNAILGEKITGSSSDAIAQITSIISSTQVEIAYLNSDVFTTGEVVNFNESNISTTLQLITAGNALNVTNIFKLDKGQRDQFYDYSRLVRKQNFSPPSRKLLVIFDRYDVPSNDTGDFYTVESYDEERFSYDIPNIGGQSIRSSDVIDFRPRVTSPYTGSISPFIFQSRDFNTTINPEFITTPNESSILGYNYYLPRIDKIILDQQGFLSIIKGESNVDPKPPIHSKDSMQIASVSLPAYLYNPNDAEVNIIDNTRYTMRDIGGLEDRIENLEVTTSLSLLELDTKTLQVQDPDGLSRFKSGFFVDDFKNTDLVDSSDPDCRITVDSDAKELLAPVDFWSIPVEVALDTTVNIDTADFSEDLPLLDPNCRKTGETITLDYEEVTFLDQPLASRVENVNPFNMIQFNGLIQLKPFSDSWVRTVKVDGGTITRTGNQNRTFTRTEVISVDIDSYIRSRNVTFDAHSLKPQTRVYPFFDSTSGIDIIPKLVQIEMVNGIFEVGETVDVFNNKGKITASFRITRPDHKGGSINKPKETYKANPYDKSTKFGKKYSASSDVLNVDTRSLSDEAQGKYFGFIKKNNSTILGRSSGAQAKVTALKLVTDVYGDVLGSFFFRNPLRDPPPPLRFKTGVSTFKLTSSKNNKENLPGSVTISDGETTYETDGLVETIRKTKIIETMPPPPPPRPRRRRRRRRPARRGGCDPLAQSFTVDETGMHLTSVDLFFGTKDPEEKLIVEVRTMELGTPTNMLVDDFSQVFVNPDDIKVSDDASVPTRVTFPSPIHLDPNREYALVLIAPTTNNYEAWVARMGEKTVNTQSLPDAESVLVTKQYIGGSLFKSQNGTIWTASQFEDMKVTLYKAKFSTTPGSVFLYNPKLDAGSDVISRLSINAIKTLPRKLKVGIVTTTATDIVANLGFGVQVSDETSTGAIQGYIEQTGGPIKDDNSNTGLTITAGGSGYANGTYNNVPLFAITGRGTGATGIVTVTNNAVSAIKLTGNTGGSGYVVGDLLGITTSNVTKGVNATITVSELNGRSTLYLNNVQGEEFTTGRPLVVYNGSNTISYANTTITSSAIYDEKYAGNVIEVAHYNHGMHSDNNLFTIQDVEPNTSPIELTDFLDVDDQVVSVASTTSFATYNGISTSQGYLKVNGEVIFYSSIGTNQLGIGTRGVDNTIVRTHDVGSISRKYELNGFDLRKINTDLSTSDTTALSQAKTIDSYYINLDRGIATGDDQTSFTNEQNLGGDNIHATQNYQFDSVIPDLHTFTPSTNTKLTSQIRTVTGTSAGGNEVSFIDKGFEPVVVYESNRLDSPRIVCSRRNEISKLPNLPKRRSFTLAFRLETTDPNLSPTVNLNDPQVILERTRLNKPIEDYAKDGRSNEPTGDPHAGVYISNRIDLKNPATSLKVFVAAYRHPSADFRLLYQLIREDGTETELSYELFPGFDNLKDTDGDNFGDQIIDSAKNSGRPDAFVSPSKLNEFRDYQFSIDNLDEFTGFRFKLVMSGTNEAFAPRFKDFRAIALA